MIHALWHIRRFWNHLVNLFDIMTTSINGKAILFWTIFINALLPFLPNILNNIWTTRLFYYLQNLYIFSASKFLAQYSFIERRYQHSLWLHICWKLKWMNIWKRQWTRNVFLKITKKNMKSQELIKYTGHSI